MGSLTPEIRKRIVKAYNKGYRIKDIAAIFGVNRWLFMAAAIYINHSVFFSCRTVKEQANACCVRQKSNCLIGEKRDATVHPRVLR